MRNVANTWRNYALNDESGVQICTWPEGTRKPVIPLPYASETMHGFEWAFACHMLMVGMYEEAMTVVKSIRDRYDGEKRNPWNEIECGSNYARSMASYSFINAFSGFRFDLTRGMIGFKPLATNQEFRCFWSLGSAWGEYSFSDGKQTITVKHGSIDLKEFELPGIINDIYYDDNKMEFDRGASCCTLSEMIKLSANSQLIFAS